MMGYGDWAWYGWLWMAFGLAVCAAVVGLFIYAVTRDGTHREGGPTAEEILRRRLASGEIDAAEYEARRRTLHG
jgi:uncharacterized membrane protein